MTTRASRIWSPFSHLPGDRDDPVTIVSGQGAYVEDANGRRYLDATAGLWYCLIGHGRAEMAEAIARQVRTLEAFKTHGEYDNPPARELAGQLATLFPVEDPLAFFTSGGGDSIETACKLARSYWEVVGAPSKRVILTREGAYHGMHGFGSSISGLPALRDGHEDGYPADVVPCNDVDALEHRISAIGPDRIAAFVAEPVIGAGGVIPPAPGYLTAAEQLCRANDVLFVCDEVVTGFGRMGSWSGAEYYGLTPDIAVLAKGITSGYVPLGAVLASGRIWSAFEQTGSVFRHGYTYSGHPTACAAALANLDILREERLPERAATMAPALTTALHTLLDEPLVTEVRTVGLMAGIGLRRDLRRPGRHTPDPGAEMVRLCRERGVIVRRMFQGDLQISPPLMIDGDDVALLTQALRDAADQCYRSLA